jgi:hypothetical protein
LYGRCGFEEYVDVDVGVDVGVKIDIRFDEVFDVSDRLGRFKLLMKGKISTAYLKRFSAGISRLRRLSIEPCPAAGDY